MELKQLKFFMAACECGTLGKAAVRLYTTQPNVSKVIRALEDELGSPLFERTPRGLRLTPYGRSIHEYADTILKNASLITRTQPADRYDTFSVSTYPSNIVAWILVDVYKTCPGMVLEHNQGTVDEITAHVAQGVSELGIVYVSKRQLPAFRHIIAHKKLEFMELGKREACIYVGPGNPLYNRTSISLEEISRQRFVRGLNDFFSMEHHLEQVDVGAVSSEKLDTAVYTNSEHLAVNLLLKTDLVELGINIRLPGFQQYDIRNLAIQGEASCLTLGYVVEKGHALTAMAGELIDRLSRLIDT